MRMGSLYALPCVFLPPFILPPVAQSGEEGVYGSFFGGGSVIRATLYGGAGGNGRRNGMWHML
jgi:hypothetical protein